jgi:type IV pilus assembly protein PilM
MLRKRKSVIGLDIGTSCVKAVEVIQDKLDYTITAYGQVDIPNEESRFDAISELLANGGFSTKRVATAVSGKSVIFRYINMTPMSSEALHNSIHLEADQYIPFEIDEVQLCTQKLLDHVGGEDTADEMKVLLVAAKNALVEEQAQMLVDLGLQPVSIGVDSFALGNAFELGEMMSSVPQSSGRTIALLDIGSSKSSINIVRDNVTCFAREVPTGGLEITDSIIRRLGIGADEAEALKRDPQDRVADVQEAVNHVLDDLGNEVNLSFDFFENQFDGEVEEVFLSGGSALLPFLEGSLESIFEKKTRVWNPTEGLKVEAGNVDVDQLHQVAPQLAIALGLAATVA